MLTISVIIPNHNHAGYLHEALEAILNQSRAAKEIIFVDDASTDDSLAIVSQFQKKHSHLKLIQLSKNSGGPEIPILEGLKHATGDYLALCASDDIPQQGFFEETLKFFQLNPNLGFCFGNSYLFKDEKPYKYVSAPALESNKPLILYPDDMVRTCQMTSFRFPSQATVYRRDLLEKYGGHDPKLEALADFYLNLQIAFRHPVGFIPKYFSAYRKVPASYSKRKRFNIKLRQQICSNLLLKIKKEDLEFQKRIRKSRILSYQSIFMMGYLMIRPWLWHYLPVNFIKQIAMRVLPKNPKKV